MTSGNEERKDAHAPLVVLIGDAQVNGLERGEGRGRVDRRMEWGREGAGGLAAANSIGARERTNGVKEFPRDKL